MEQGQSSRKSQGTDIPYKGLYGEAPPEKGDWCRLQAFIKGEGFYLKYMKRVVKSFRYLKGSLMKTFRTDKP